MNEDEFAVALAADENRAWVDLDGWEREGYLRRAKAAWDDYDKRHSEGGAA